MNDRVTFAFGTAFAVAAMFNALLFMAKELSPALLAWMTGVTGHHWATQGALDMALFVVLGLALLAVPSGTAASLTRMVVGSTVASSVLIMGAVLVL